MRDFWITDCCNILGTCHTKHDYGVHNISSFGDGVESNMMCFWGRAYHLL